MDRKSEVASSDAETRLLSAFDRLETGTPKVAKFQRGVDRGETPISVSSIALEAGFARSYPYKNKSSLPRFWSRLYEMRRITKRNRATSSVTNFTLLLRERNLAIDIAAQLSLEVERMRLEMITMRRFAAASDFESIRIMLSKNIW